MRDMGFLRTVCALVAASAGIFYLTSASSLSSDGRWSLIGVTFISALLWVLLGGRGVKNNSTSRVKTASNEVESDDSEDGDDESASLLIDDNNNNTNDGTAGGGLDIDLGEDA